MDVTGRLDARDPVPAQRGHCMVHAYVLGETEVGHGGTVAADDLGSPGHVVAERIQAIAGITRRLTCTIVPG